MNFKPWSHKFSICEID